METIEEWDENIGITFWKEGRVKLNKVIRKYNKWVKNHTKDKVKAYKLLAKIEEHLSMDYCNQDGGSGYRFELIKMKINIESTLVFHQTLATK